MLETRSLRRLHVGPIDLQIEQGACVSVAGRSGSGKSVLLRMIADLDPHDGDALLDGKAWSAMPAHAWRRLVTYVAADSGWWADGVGDHFAADVDLPSLLAEVGLDPQAASWTVARLSTGERQRLALLRALCPGNRVLLLDEPTSGLDAGSTERVEALLRARMARGTAILLVTHDPGQALRMASRNYLLDDGRLHEQGGAMSRFASGG